MREGFGDALGDVSDPVATGSLITPPEVTR